MSVDGRFRRIRAAIGNAFVFAAGWTLGGFIIWFVLRQAGAIPHLSILSGIGMSIRVGFMGFIAGAFFPAIMRLAYKGKRLSEINWLRFGLVGALITGLFVPTFMETMSVLTGGGWVPFSLIRGDIVLSALLGGLASAFSLKLAQYADRIFPDTFQNQLERLERQTLLTESVDTPLRTRERSGIFSRRTP